MDIWRICIISMLALSVAGCTVCNRVYFLKVLKVLKKYIQSFVCSWKHPLFTPLCIKEGKMQLLCYGGWQTICFRMGNMWNNLMFYQTLNLSLITQKGIIRFSALMWQIQHILMCSHQVFCLALISFHANVLAWLPHGLKR